MDRVDRVGYGICRLGNSGFLRCVDSGNGKPSPQSTVAFPDEAKFAKKSDSILVYTSTEYIIIGLGLDLLMHSSAVFAVLSVGLATLFVAGVFGPMGWGVAVPFVIFVFGMIWAHLVYALASGVLFFRS